MLVGWGCGAIDAGFEPQTIEDVLVVRGCDLGHWINRHPGTGELSLADRRRVKSALTDYISRYNAG